MTIAEMLEQSGILTLLGMGIVFVFLVILIFCVTLVGKLIHLSEMFKLEMKNGGLGKMKRLKIWWDAFSEDLCEERDEKLKSLENSIDYTSPMSSAHITDDNGEEQYLIERDVKRVKIAKDKIKAKYQALIFKRYWDSVVGVIASLLGIAGGIFGIFAFFKVSN
ncbi:hypothetical protein AGMMS49940_01390 [Spirochaetia bacterium]|nr:hypothetical protein AGMMS49940_01390 [Spirochaetia bacterium]